MQQNIVQTSSDLPPELFVKPLALIGVSGLDVVNNAVHKAIWETFSSNRRIERAAVMFKLIRNDHEFPVVKPKRNSYDWYIPKGILKKNWMNKHLYEIPSVMVIFYDLDWNDPQWSEKMIECASRVQSLRAALEGRSTRIVVVLIQNCLPLPAGEDALAAQRAEALCGSCELPSQSLFVLPHGDHLQGYAVRLENAFYDFSQTYYHNKAKNVKSHKEHLNKNVHQNLFVRHQYKTGFFFELKQDLHSAHKHYIYAYNNLLEIRVVDTNALEIRTVAGFICYKLCRLLFTLNLPRDAISQFKAHIDRFKNRVGFQELAFEHYAWLSKQYAIFGDIFDEAVKLGLPAVQTQHPGIYYQQGAQYAILRKKSCQELCSNVTAYPSPDPLEGANHMEYYGQRPWRPGKVTAEPPDPHLESSGIMALQFVEKQTGHSNLIISLYGQAISQFKTYRCPRTRRHLVLEMADEYYDSKDFGKALTLYTHMLWDFRNEKWWSLLSKILEKAIICAFLTANVQDYVHLAIEILGSSIHLGLNDKRRIYENLNRILKKQIPFGDPKLPHDILQNAIIVWQPVFTTTTTSMNLLLDMANMTACIETKARFMKSMYEVDQNVTVEIYIRSTCPFPLTFSRVSVTVTTTNYSAEFAVTNVDDVLTLNFHVDEVKKFIIDFSADPNDINQDIQISSINLTLSSCPDVSVDLKYSPTISIPRNCCPELLHFKHTRDKLDFDNITPLSHASIVPRESKLKVEFIHKHPALQGEWYEIKVNITNDEQFGIGDLKIDVGLEEETSDVDLSLKPMSQQAFKKILHLENEQSNLEMAEHFCTNFYMRSKQACKTLLKINITYTLLNNTKPVLSIKQETLVLSIVQPFEINTKYLTMQMSDLDRFYIGEDFGVMNYVIFSSPWPIVIENTSFEFFNPVISSENQSSSHIAGMTFNEGEIGSELRLANCLKATDKNVNLGTYTIQWKRQNGLTTSTDFIVKGLHCDYIPLGLSTTAPAHGFVRTPMLLQYHVHNKTVNLIQLDVHMEASETFMFSGYKQFMVSVLPNSTRTIQYNLYPLIAGNVALPKLSLTYTESTPILNQDQLNLLIDRCLPTHIYVMPQLKGDAKVPEATRPRNLSAVG